MRIIFLLLTFVLTTVCYSQQNTFLRFGPDMNINVYTPYTSKLNNVKSTYKIKSNTFNAGFDFRVFQMKKYSFYIGANYKKIKYTKIDAISSTQYGYGGMGQTYYSTYTYKDKPDLISNSHSLGASLEIDYSIITTENYKMSLGFKPTVYFLEWNNAAYHSSDDTQFSEQFDPQPIVTELPKTFFLSSINSQLIYRISLLPKNGRAILTGKVSLGANIFSDWEQFKRYAWLGVGVEVGFLRKKKE